KELKDAPGAGTTPGTGGGPGAGGRLLRVGAAPVQVRTVTYTIDALGSIEAEQEVQVVAGVEGIVTSLSFREGDEVTPDTVLATIDPDRFRVVAERARAAFEKAEAEHRQAAADLARRETLSRESPPLISEEDVQRARQDAERLRAAAAEARAQFELARIDRERSIVRPLVPGIINSRTVDIGQHVENSAVMATLVDTRRLNLRFRVSEQESTRLRGGATVRFTTASLPGRTFNARVFHVASGADPATRMVVCLARIERDGKTLKPGFFAEVHADVESRKDAIVVPERAVQPTERGFVTFEVRDGRAVLRQVSLGLRTGDGGVEILTGLEAGAVVVTDGGDVLRDGSPVEVVADDGGAGATR
ncbi:MAG: efflux RND transporter periplasmic adaptor subunit, partial [Candidatus Polarisedimenticolia bacterium]